MTHEEAQGNEKIMLNGNSLDEVVGFTRMAYETMKTDTGAFHDPVKERRKRIHTGNSALEETVKGIMGGNEKADKATAQKIVKSLAYEAAKAKGYHGELKEFSDEQVREYLSQASNATGDPTIGNKWGLIKSIMSMVSAKPGTSDYNADAPLGHLIRYIVAQKDEESQKLNYFRTIASEQWQEPGTGLEMIKAFRAAFPEVPLSKTATAGEFFNHLETLYGAQSQTNTIKNDPKPYLDIPAHYAAANGPKQGGADAHQPHQ